MHSQPESLSAAAADLERTLQAPIDPGTWAAHLEESLARVQKAILSNARGLEVPGGGLVDVGADQSPSPGLDRRVERLLDDLGCLLEETRSARASAHHAAEGAPLALDHLRDRSQQLLEALRKHEQEQARVVLESVTTDLGAGD
jgi:hypothetical protein